MCLRVIRNAWRFCYALCFVLRAVCVSLGILLTLIGLGR
ncbi:DUF3265 domain-containing protein [Vibrio parahaemolyticus]|nr:DUF3265 domain-containing protein [Vibrio alginolyticus]TBT85178.1 DUF3265 domain-containing protein [Vibrio parahaemolyticus]